MATTNPFGTDDVLNRIDEAFTGHSLIALVLSDPIHPDDSVARKQTFRPVTIRGELQYQLASRIGKQEKHENLGAQEVLQRVRDSFGSLFRDLYLYTSEADIVARHGGTSVRQTVSPPSRTLRAMEHDRRKHYLIPEGVPCPFLHALGVMTDKGMVVRSKQHKFRQINRYLELVDDIYPALPAAGTLHVVDFGCGLSYLTFAVHHLLTVIHGRAVDVMGIDRNSEVISRCTKIAHELDLKGLRFIVGEISEHPNDADSPLHLAISLHACDVATDDALAFAVERGAQVILSAPCCQHELAGKISNDSLTLITRHGTLRERLAALASDALRAAALEAVGYRTQVLEFIETEHTPKNLLVRAVLREGPTANEPGRVQYEELRNYLGAESLASDRILEAGMGSAGRE